MLASLKWDPNVQLLYDSIITVPESFVCHRPANNQNQALGQTEVPLVLLSFIRSSLAPGRTKI
jgi:hypothetical protein